MSAKHNLAKGAQFWTIIHHHHYCFIF